MSDRPRTALPDDILWAKRLREGDREAFGQLIDEFRPAVEWVARNPNFSGVLTADDLIQETFQRLWLVREEYDPNVSSLRTFVVMLARRLAINAGRVERRRHQAEGMVASTGAILDPTSPPHRSESERQLVVREFLAELTDAERRILVASADNPPGSPWRAAVARDLGISEQYVGVRAGRLEAVS